MADDTSIVNLITDRLVTVIVDNMMEDVEPDETALGLARAGRLQDNPLKARMNLLVRPGGDSWPDIVIPPNYYFYSPQYEMPYGESWLRRVVAEYDLFMFGRTRSECRTDANVVFSRLKSLIGEMNRNNGLADLTDTFGESAVMVHMTKQRVREGGGPPSNFIWTGVQYIEFVTNQSFEET